jgi:hypothetical protein
MTSTAPIALFVYNRLEHTRRTVEALLGNELASDSQLWIFSDGPKTEADAPKVAAVRTYLKSITGFQSIHVLEQSVNRGLAQSIIHGVTQVCREHGRVIVVEDDLITSPHFLRYMNDGLSLYEHNEEVVSIHGYIYPVTESLPETFFLKGADCWGWATWQRGWEVFNPDGPALLAELERRGLVHEFDFAGNTGYTAMLRDQIAGRNNSWAIRWYASAFLRNKLTLYPGTSLVQNIGHDGSGEHCGTSNAFDVSIGEQALKLKPLPLVENQQARLSIQRYLQAQRRPTFSERLGRLFGRK